MILFVRSESKADCNITWNPLYVAQNKSVAISSNSLLVLVTVHEFPCSCVWSAAV